MRTLIRVANANCTYCMNDVRDALLACPLVHAVHSSAVAGCWEIDHDRDDLDAITHLLHESLHGWEIANNGEINMIATAPEIHGRCALHGTDLNQS